MAHTLTIEAFGARLRAGTLTAAGVLENCLGRIGAENERLRAFVTVLADDARREAAERDRELAAGLDRGPLHGVPVAVKDLIDIAGVPTTASSHVRDGHVATSTAPVVANLRRAGAVIVGKTNLHEFAYGTTSDDSAYGAVRNPHDPSRSPGGSSGGSAVALVTGMALGALGTDTGGSIRIPAAACGTVGLKPTYGEVCADGVVPLSRTLDHVGPMTTSVTDAWIMHRALLGVMGGALRPARAVQGLRLGVPRAYLCEVLDTEVRAHFDASIDDLRRAGATVRDVVIPHASATPAVYVHIHASESTAYHARMLDLAPERYTPPVRMRLEMGRYVMAQDYLLALEGQQALRREVDAAMSDVDALLLPSMPIPAQPIGADTVLVNGSTELVRPMMLRLTQLFNLTGHPALSMPCGWTSQGLPTSLQFVGRRFETEALLALGVGCEAALATRLSASRR